MNSFTILPAIDLRGGRCVRLLQGREDAETVYGTDPIVIAKRWVDDGAEYLHVVDLDGAFQGASAQHDLIGRIIASVPIPVEVGGGLRTDDEVRRMIGYGAARAILGTRAWSEPDQVQKLVTEFGAKLAVGIDARDGQVQIRGWTETTSLTAVDLAKKADAMGVATLIVTDTATDGMLQGPNLKAMESICDAVRCSVIASGGVTTSGDIRALRALGRSNLAGAIVGKALYEGASTLAELQRAAR
ncbi:MAG: 1-(5-phosphoribosyl)-5-[(5-phosphoribosylamino)methylideneamino]imidazole-4-carboxamide isomerase [bacterium]